MSTSQRHLIVFLVWTTSCVWCQTLPNIINVPPSGLIVVAGEPITITWQNPSSGTVTIRLLQGSEITSTSGIVLISNIPATAETATFTIPSDVNSEAYDFAIVDDTNPDNINFSPSFKIVGGTNTTPSTSANLTTSTTNHTDLASATSSTSAIPSASSSLQFSSLSSSTSSSSSSTSSAAAATSLAESAASSLSPGAYAGIGVGATLAVLTLGIFVYVLFRRHRRNTRNKPTVTEIDTLRFADSVSKSELQGDPGKQYGLTSSMIPKSEVETPSNRHEAEDTGIPATLSRPRSISGRHELPGEYSTYLRNGPPDRGSMVNDEENGSFDQWGGGPGAASIPKSEK